MPPAEDPASQPGNPEDMHRPGEGGGGCAIASAIWAYRQCMVHMCLPHQLCDAVTCIDTANAA